jgi:radical SAM superfamily enzyme YgiQ (UPF0313 family)
MTYWYPGVWEAVKTVKKIFPKIPVLLGGTYSTLCPDHAKRSGADYIIRGDFISLNKKLADLGFNLHMPGSFADYPAADFSFYPKSEYAVLRMSAGCPFRCSYCAQNILCDNKYEIKPRKRVFEEIKVFAGRGIKNIVFYDDALLYNADENIKPLLRQIIKNNLKINIHTPNGLHARYLDLELAELMKEAGFIKPRFSLETSDSGMQKDTGSKVSNNIYISAMRMLQQAGYKKGEYITYLLIGMPGQSLGSVESSIKFVNSLGSGISLSEYSLIPQTKDFERQLKLTINGKDFEKEPLLHNKSIFPLFNPGSRNEISRLKILAKDLNSLL